MKISNDTISNRTRDLPACSAVPQPTVPSCVPDLRCTPDYLLLGLKMESHLLQCASLKNYILDEVQNQKTVSVNVSHALFCLLFKHDNLVMQWLRIA
jgi:hypothetical protein